VELTSVLNGFAKRTFFSGEKLTSDGQFVAHVVLRKFSILLGINAHGLLDPNSVGRRAIRGQHFNAS
jgi:hypothetical protein